MKVSYHSGGKLEQKLAWALLIETDSCQQW